LSKVNHIFLDIHDETIKHQLEKNASGHSGLYRRDDEYLSSMSRQRILKKYAKDNQFISDNFIGNNDWYAYQGTSNSVTGSSDSLFEALDVMTLTFSKIMSKDC